MVANKVSFAMLHATFGLIKLPVLALLVKSETSLLLSRVCMLFGSKDVLFLCCHSVVYWPCMV